MPENSNLRFANETCDSEICVPSPNGGTDGRTIACQFALTSVIEPKTIPTLSSVITGDECWVYGYDPETKQMSSKWSTSSSPRPKKVRQVKSNIKTRLIAFFDINRLVHHEFVLTGQTVNKEFYKTVLQRLRDAVRTRRPEKWRSGNWILHHDNAPAHRAATTNEFLVKYNIPSLPHPPYSPDLAPGDFLFPQLKKTTKGRRFDYVEEIQANATRQLRAITKK